MAKEDEYAQVRMPSGEVRKIHINVPYRDHQASSSNFIEHENQVIGKAGRIRHMGKRPSVPRYRDESRRPSARRR